MRRYFFKNSERFYKANLHCHSTFSDGKLTPEQLKDYYKSHGYSVLSLTDHEVLIAHPELNDADFLTLPGYEISVNEKTDNPRSHRKTCHMNLYPKAVDNLKQLFFTKELLRANAVHHADKIIIGDEKDYPRVYTPKCISDIVKIANEHGFLVTYNHPTWSLETYNEYMNYDGFFAMEIYNHGCFSTLGNLESNQRVYDDMLRGGKRLYCVATDDNHNVHHKTQYDDSLGGFIMIMAHELSHNAIIDALQKGDFYASTGPSIHSLYLENNEFHIECSDAISIFMLNSGRKATHIIAEQGKVLNGGVFKLPKDETSFLRFKIVDASGNFAATRAFYKEEYIV